MNPIAKFGMFLAWMLTLTLASTGVAEASTLGRQHHHVAAYALGVPSVISIVFCGAVLIVQFCKQCIEWGF